MQGLKGARVSSDMKAVAEQELIGEQKKIEQLLKKNIDDINIMFS